MASPSESARVRIIYKYGLTVDSTLIILEAPFPAPAGALCSRLGTEPKARLGKIIQTKIIPTLVSWGPGGVFLLAMADSTGIPMVGGVDAFIVLVAIVNRSQAYLAAATAILGSLIGSLILFMIARKGGEEYHRHHTSSARGNKLKAWFDEYGLLTVFVPAIVPIIPLPLKIFIICAGALEESPVTFSLVLMAARVPRYVFLAWLGLRLGNDTIPFLRQHVWELILLASVLFVLLYLLVRVVHDRRVSKAPATAPE